MVQVWFTSDPHIGHANIAGLRGFDDVAEHDAALAANWDRVVKSIDQVWVLGDVSMSGKRNVERALRWIADRPGTKHLIAGNHDNCHPMHSDAHKWQRPYLEVFETVQQSAVRKIHGHRVRLSHFPYRGDHTTLPRYMEWRFPDDGEYLLHGHTHSREVMNGNQIHVGVDAHNFAPVSLNWVEEVILDDDRSSRDLADERWP